VADASTSNRLRKHAHLGNPRRLSATTFRPFVQARHAPDTFVPLGAVAMRILRKLDARR
jgi:hypothetical protein